MRFLFAAAMALALAVPAAADDLPPFYAAMNRPQAPFRISDDVYYVGASDVTAFLIDTGDGLILTDGGFRQTASQIEANIKTLGFDIKNVKILLNSHAHFDHAGGLAALKAASGAELYASSGDAPVLASGGASDFANDAHTPQFPPIRPDVVVEDGRKIVLGHTVLSAHVTAGHTRGCTSWTLTTHVKGKPENVLFICSLTVLPHYRLVTNPSYPGIADDYLRSIATLKALPCDIFLAAHGSFFDLQGKYARLGQNPATNPFVDPAGCRAYIDAAETQVKARIAQEKDGK